MVIWLPLVVFKLRTSYSPTRGTRRGGCHIPAYLSVLTGMEKTLGRKEVVAFPTYWRVEVYDAPHDKRRPQSKRPSAPFLVRFEAIKADPELRALFIAILRHVDLFE